MKRKYSVLTVVFFLLFSISLNAEAKESTVQKFQVVLIQDEKSDKEGTPLSDCAFVLSKKENGRKVFLSKDLTGWINHPVGAKRFISDALGKIEIDFKGLKDGEYFLSQTLAPEGVSIVDENMNLSIIVGKKNVVQKIQSSMSEDENGIRKIKCYGTLALPNTSSSRFHPMVKIIPLALLIALVLTHLPKKKKGKWVFQ